MADRTRKLLLFDIDGTLLNTGGAGMRAIRQAGRALIDRFDAAGDLPEINLAGATDSGLVAEILTHLSIDVRPENIEAFYRDYLEGLKANLADSARRGEGALAPGIADLLSILSTETPHVLALLTGNIARGAEIKLRHFEVWQYFRTGAFGDDHHDRDRLGPIALRRVSRHHGIEFEPVEVLVIGDTPRDIRCGKVLNATTVAVATGSCDAGRLAEHDPDHLFDDFADPRRVLAELGLLPDSSGHAS